MTPAERQAQRKFLQDMHAEQRKQMLAQHAATRENRSQIRAAMQAERYNKRHGIKPPVSAVSSDPFHISAPPVVIGVTPINPPVFPQVSDPLPPIFSRGMGDLGIFGVDDVLVGGLLTTALGVGGSLFGHQQAIDAQKDQNRAQLQSQYAQERAQQALVASQMQAQLQQNEFTAEKTQHDTQTLALFGVAGLSVALAAIFIWRATKK